MLAVVLLRGEQRFAELFVLGRIGRAVELIPAIQAARQSGGVHLLEVPGDRAANVLVHRRIAAAVRAAIPPS